MYKRLTTFLFLIIGFTLPTKPVLAEYANSIDRKVQIDNSIEKMTSNEFEFSLDTIIVKYKSKNNPEEVHVDTQTLDGSYTLNNNRLVKNLSKDTKVNNIQMLLEEYLNDPSVEYAQPAYIYRPTVWDRVGNQDTPSDWNDTNHWYYERQNLPEMFQDQDCYNSDSSPCGGDSNITIAVLDTGLAYETRTTDFKSVDGNDTELAFEFDTALDFTGGNFSLYNNSDETNCTNGIDDDLNGYIDDCNGYNPYEEYICDYFNDCTNSQLSEGGHPNDDFGHGTFVSGSIASMVDNGYSLSPGFNLTLMPIKVFERITHSSDPTNGPGAYDQIICNGIDYAVENGADVINMSFGSSASSQFLQNCMDDAKKAGVVLVASSGNLNTDVAYPAAFQSVISVGASDSSDNKANYSSYGENLDIVAAVGDGSGAGNSMWQQSYTCFDTHDCHLDVENSYKSFSTQFGIGTSYASPQVAAAAGLILSNNNGLTPDEVKFILLSSAEDISSTGFDTQTGYGLLDYESLNLFETSLKKQYFTWYDTSRLSRNAWILVGNPSPTEEAHINIIIGDGSEINKYYTIEPGGRVTPEYRDIKNGPVIITSDIDVFASQRVMYEGTFNEYAGIPTTALTNEYYFTWYDTSRPTRLAWILVGNPSTTTDANVNIKIGDPDSPIIDEDYIISPGGRVTPEFRDIKNGPVTVTSDIDVFASQRVMYEGSFNEYAGIPSTSLTDTYYFTWYDTSRTTRLAWILVGNPSTTTDANVNIKIGDGSIVNDDYVIPPGGRVTPEYRGIKNGPVIVTSDIDVFASQRVMYENSFNEYSSIPVTSLTDTYYFTWYDTSRIARNAWILIGNPSSDTSANINIKIGDGSVVNEDYVIPPGGRVTPEYRDIKNGPVVVTSDIDVFTSQRVMYEGSFNEYPGISY